MRSANFSGVLVTGVWPIPWSRPDTSGDFNARTTSVLSFATSAAGVAAGTTMPYHSMILPSYG